MEAPQHPCPIPEFSRRHRVPEPSIYRHARQAKFPAVQIGRTWLIDEQAALTFYARREAGRQLLAGV